MIIDNDLLNKLAYLCLHDLNAMVDWVKQLDELDIQNNVVLEESFKLKSTSLRSDVALNLLSHEQALALAPSSDSNYFRVPSVKGVSPHTDLNQTS